MSETGKHQGIFEMETYKKIVYPNFSREVLGKLELKTFLDYGCGDGYMATLLEKNIEKTLYDINHGGIKEDELKKEKHSYRIIDSLTELKMEKYKNYFDVILLSFVLICIQEEETYSDILKTIKHVKKEDGKLIILDCHPCFMHHRYSYFYTACSENFEYLSDKDNSFTKIIRGYDKNDPSIKKEVSFRDYHRPLSFTINTLVECGFKIVKMKEWPDLGFDINKKNELYPPLYHLECE